MARSKGDQTMSVINIKRKNKNKYRAEVYVRGVKLGCQTFSSKTLAWQWHDAEKERLENPKKAKKKEIQEMTFKEVIKRFKKERIPYLKSSTAANYEQLYKYLLEDKKTSNIKMCDFDSEVVDEWLSWLLKHKTVKNKGRKSFNLELKRLSAILNWYKNYISADFNVPVVKRHRERCFYKPIKSRRPDYYINPEDIRNWLKELEKCYTPIYWHVAQFMTLTGARVGEACGLKWSEIDLERKTARIIRIVSWHKKNKKPYVVESTKTEESVRMLILPQILVDLLWEIKTTQGNGEEFVFLSPKGSLLKYNAIQNAFNRAFKRLGLPWRSTHICRHTFATIALMATRDLSAVQAALGHTDIKITQRYAKAVALLSSDTAEKTAAMFNLDENKTKKDRSFKNQNIFSKRKLSIVR